MTKQHRATPPNDGAALAALRQVADNNTVHSLKQTLLTCMIIRAVRPPPRGRTIITGALALTSLAAVHWRAWTIVIHLFH